MAAERYRHSWETLLELVTSLYKQSVPPPRGTIMGQLTPAGTLPVNYSFTRPDDTDCSIPEVCCCTQREDFMSL